MYLASSIHEGHLIPTWEFYLIKNLRYLQQYNQLNIYFDETVGGVSVIGKRTQFTIA